MVPHGPIGNSDSLISNGLGSNNMEKTAACQHLNQDPSGVQFLFYTRFHHCTALNGQQVPTEQMPTWGKGKCCSSSRGTCLLKKRLAHCENQVQIIGMEKVQPGHATTTGKGLLGTVVMVSCALQIRLSGNNVKGYPLNTRELSQGKVKRKQRLVSWALLW